MRAGFGLAAIANVGPTDATDCVRRPTNPIEPECISSAPVPEPRPAGRWRVVLMVRYLWC